MKHLKLRGKCTIIVVTTIVRFSTEESLETCGSIIFTNLVYSFQYPICKEKTVVSEAFQSPPWKWKWTYSRDTSKHYWELRCCHAHYNNAALPRSLLALIKKKKEEKKKASNSLNCVSAFSTQWVSRSNKLWKYSINIYEIQHVK